MKRDLHSLIRLHDWKVDERRRAVAALLRRVAELEKRAHDLERQLVEEQKIAAAAPAEAGFLYGNYAVAVIGRREELKEAIAQTENEIAVARDALREAFRDFKKYELAQRNRDKRLRAEEARQEQIVLDEVGVLGHRRGRGG